MPTYVYGCNADKEHEEVEVAHGINQPVKLECSECGAPMHRVPQVFTFYGSPFLALRSHLEEKYRKNKHRRMINGSR